MNLALFDFDGTITTRETFPDFVRAAVSPRRMTRGRLVLAPWVVGYRLGWVSGVTVRARISDFVFRGRSEREVAAIGERFAAEFLPALLRPEAMERIAWHRERGDTVVVVSGGFDTYLRHWCAQHGLDLLCSSLEARDGVLTGRYRGAQCVGAEKARLVRQRYDLSRFAAIHAYGDTPEDRELLELAHHRVYRWQDAA